MSTASGVPDADRLARVTLNLLTEPGEPQIARLVEELDAETIVAVLRSGQHSRLFSTELGSRLEAVDPAAVLERAADQGIRYVIPSDPEWPRQLGALRGCGSIHDRGGVPLGLWVRGDPDLREATAQAIAVVGSRAASIYGEEQAGVLSSELAGAGNTIVSGGGFGVDQAAHGGALRARGATIAVLACGVDRAYPTAHTALLHDIARTGLVVSECPLGVIPTRTRFVGRHRVIAGLSQGTLLVESAAYSGALSTGNWTTHLGRPLLAVPGPVTSATTAGAHQLIRAGSASLVTGAEDILTDIAQHQAAAAGSAPAIDETYVPRSARGRDQHRVPTGHPVGRPGPGRR
jgi:DNA processing protein